MSKIEFLKIKISQEKKYGEKENREKKGIGGIREGSQAHEDPLPLREYTPLGLSPSSFLAGKIIMFYHDLQGFLKQKTKKPKNISKNNGWSR